MAISPSGNPYSPWRPAGSASTSTSRVVGDAASREWGKIMASRNMPADRAAIRPDTAAAIKAAQHLWLAADGMPARESASSNLDREMDAFITLLVDQASMSKQRP